MFVSPRTVSLSLLPTIQYFLTGRRWLPESVVHTHARRDDAVPDEPDVKQTATEDD